MTPTNARAESLETLLQTRGHLEFMEGLIDRHCLSRPEQLDAIESRLNDDHLYVATVGEFNAGKSTLINALLRDELLRAKALVATGAATYLRYGNKLYAWAFRNGGGEEHPVSDVKEFITSATSDPNFAPQLSHVEVRHPAHFLESGVVIIDTPGFDGDKIGHSEVTERVVGHESDLAIIAIDVNRPVADSLAKFVKQNLSGYLHRCIFVVTKIDLIEEEEVEDVLDTIRGRISAMMGIARPELLVCAPRVVLDEIGKTPGKWTKSFQSLEADLISRLERQRTLSIAETIVRMMDSSLSELQAGTERARHQYAVARDQLEQNRIQDLDQFLETTCDKFLKSIDGPVDANAEGFIALAKKQYSELNTNIVELIRSAESKAQLAQKVQNGLDGIVTASFKSVEKGLQKKTNAMGQAIGEARTEMNQSFKDAFERIGTFDFHAEVGSSRSSLQSGASLSKALAFAKSMEEKESQTVGGGAIGGAVLGQMLIPIPIVGWMIGGFLGGLFGGFLGPSLDSVKEETYKKIMAEVNPAFDGAVQQGIDHYQQFYTDVIEETKQDLESFVEVYGEQIASMRQAMEQDQDRLQRQEAQAKIDSAELARRLSSVQKIGPGLAQSGAINAY